ncbi:MAG: hypothetical protein KBT15_09335 [Bacteroidales bacterium]|nr:hypothetical protein [Candidatus Minthousia equi]
MKKFLVSFMIGVCSVLTCNAYPTHIVTTCGIIVYTDTDFWTDEELERLPAILSALNCAGPATPVD